MKSFKALTFAAMAGLITLAACSEGGMRRLAGVQCPEMWDPIPSTLKPGEEKLSLDLDRFEIPAGTYEYQGASLYFIDRRTDFRVMINESRDREGRMKASINCVRNAKVNMPDFAVLTEGVSGMTVTEGARKAITDVKEYGFQIRNGGRIIPKAESRGKLESPSEVYAGKVAESFMVKYPNNDVTYQIRSYGENEHGRFWLSVTFKRQEFAKGNWGF